MEKTFDRKYFNANVPLIIDRKKIKVGNLETKIGLSTGYISRLCKEDNTSKIGADLLAALSAELEVSMDLLGCCDLGGLTPRGQSIALFCEKLTQETLFADRVWERDSLGAIADAMRYKDGTTSHPLYHHEDGDIYYNSHFARKYGTQVKSDVYHTILEEKTYLYITCITYPDMGNRLDYEIYICKETGYQSVDWEVNPVCASDPQMPSGLDSILQRLYNSVAETNRQIQFSPTVQNVIDRFMNPPTPEEPTTGFSAVETDELPF